MHRYVFVYVSSYLVLLKKVTLFDLQFECIDDWFLLLTHFLMVILKTPIILLLSRGCLFFRGQQSCKWWRIEVRRIDWQIIKNRPLTIKDYEIWYFSMYLHTLFTFYIQVILMLFHDLINHRLIQGWTALCMWRKRDKDWIVWTSQDSIDNKRIQT